MDVKMLTKRYSTPMYIKVIASLLFIAVGIIMIALPVFQLIPEEQYKNAFNVVGDQVGDYSAQSYTIFTMLENDYHNGLAMAILMCQTILSMVCGVFFLFANRPKIAAAPAAVMLWTIIFSVFRSPAKLYTGVEYYGKGSGGEGFISLYKNGDSNFIFHTLGQYPIVWICGLVLLAAVIVAIAVTKTLIEKKK